MDKLSCVGIGDSGKGGVDPVGGAGGGGTTPIPPVTASDEGDGASATSSGAEKQVPQRVPQQPEPQWPVVFRVHEAP